MREAIAGWSAVTVETIWAINDRGTETRADAKGVLSDMTTKRHASRKAAPAKPRATTGAERLLPALPSVTFVEEPPAIDRFELRLSPDGSLYLKSTRERIDEFVRRCAEVGLDVQIHYISLCG